MEKLSEKRRLNHVVTKGVVCPYCGDESIEGDPVDIDNGEARQVVHCSNCMMDWTDVYTLSSIIAD